MPPPVRREGAAPFARSCRPSKGPTPPTSRNRPSPPATSRIKVISSFSLHYVRIGAGLKKCRFAFQRLLHVVHEEQAQFPDAEVGVDAHAEPAAVRHVAVVRRGGSVRPPAVAAAGEDDRVGQHELDGAVQGCFSAVSRVNIEIYASQASRNGWGVGGCENKHKPSKFPSVDFSLVSCWKTIWNMETSL